MRALLISNIYPPNFIGGYELAARDIARMLAARGHDVTVLSSPALDGALDPEEPYAVRRTLECVGLGLDPVHHDDRRIRGLYLNLRNLDALRAALAEVRPDVVFCFNLTGLGALGVLRLLEAVGAPAVAFMMDNWFEGAASHGDEYRSFLRCFAMGDPLAGVRVIACSRSLLTEIAREIDVPVTAPEVIPAWVELDGIGDDGPEVDGIVRFLYSSRIAPHKGIDIVTQAVALLRDRAVGGFTVDVYGAGLAAEAMQHVHARELESVIRYRGALTKSEMLPRYRSYDALLFASWEREPSGFVVTEAAAAGCIPLVTANLGSAEYLLDRHNCIKIRRDPADLAEAMLHILSMNASERLVFRRRVQCGARRLFDARVWYARIERILLDTVARRNTPASADAAYFALASLAHFWRAGHG